MKPEKLLRKSTILLPVFAPAVVVIALHDDDLQTEETEDGHDKHKPSSPED